MLVENSSTDTTKDIDSLDKIRKPIAWKYTQSKEDEDLVWYISERKRLMQAKRTQLDKNWKQYQKQIEAIFVPYSDWRSSSNIPLERAIIELYVAEATKRPTTFNFNGWIDFSFQWQVLERVWDDDWSINNRDSEILDNEYLTAWFWTSVIYTWYERHYRIIEDFTWEDDDGKITFQKKLQTKANILLKNIDIRYFWVDERAKKMEEAIDCIYETYITYEEFLDYYLDNNYDKEQLAAVIPDKTKEDEYKPFVINEERWDWEARFVKITQYWNTKLDRHYTVANEQYIIKRHPILNASHSLPFVIRQYGRNLFSIYGYWLCEALVTFKSDINKLREMLMEAIKKSNQETIAIGSWLEFDWNQFAFNNQFLKFKGNLQWNFNQISWTPPNQAIFTYLQELFKQIAIFTGIDIMNILWEAQQTAYQTAVQKESSLQRVNVVLKNRDAAFERLANLHKDNLQMFYPLKMVRELVNLNEDNEEIETPEAKYPTIETTKVKWKRFAKKWEKQIFEVSPETIRWDIKIDVSTDLNTPTINEVDKAQKMSFYMDIQQLTIAYQNDPELETIIPKKKAILDLAKLNNIDVTRSDDSEVTEEKKKLYDELQQMMKWGRTPDVNPNMDSADPEQSLAAIWMEWQPKEAENLQIPDTNSVAGGMI